MMGMVNDGERLGKKFPLPVLRERQCVGLPQLVSLGKNLGLWCRRFGIEVEDGQGSCRCEMAGARQPQG